MQPRRSARPAGFTLLEVILALALTALVLVILGMAVDFHLRALDNGRSHVEEAQLARAVLQLIADDLRSAVRPNPITIDGSAVSAAQSSSSSTPAASAPTGSPATGSAPSPAAPIRIPPSSSKSNAGIAIALGSSGSPSGSSGESGAETGSEAGTAAEEGTTVPDVVNSASPQAVPGIYGTADALQVDKSRRPRLEELLSQGGTAPDLAAMKPAGNIRTATYFVIPPDGSFAGQSGGLTGGVTGLVRRDLDRSAATYLESMGGTSDPLVGLESIAPEVAAIDFLYFDGAEWTDLWNSEEMGGLPRAVQIRVSIIPKKFRDRGTSSPAAAGTLVPGDLLTYTLVVHLPGSEGTTPSASSSDLGDTGAAP